MRMFLSAWLLAGLAVAERPKGPDTAAAEAVMSQLNSDVSDLRPLVYELQGLEKEYAAAKELGTLPSRREELRGRMNNALEKVASGRHALINANRDRIYQGAARALMAMKKGKTDTSGGETLVFQRFSDRAHSLILEAEALLASDEAAFKTLEARLAVDRQKRIWLRLGLPLLGAVAAFLLYRLMPRRD